MSDPHQDTVQNPWGFDWLPATVSADLFQAALEGRESLQLETKRVSGKMVAKALETLCAFANTQGGWLILGMEDADKAQGSDRYIGVDENPEAVDELLRKLHSHIQPPIETLRWWFDTKHLASHDGQRSVRLLIAQVKPSEKVHSLLDGGTWLRLQASNRQMSATEVTELSYRRGVRSAESEPVDVDFELLDTDTWRLYLRGRALAHPPASPTSCTGSAWPGRWTASCGRCVPPCCCSPTSPAPCLRQRVPARMCGYSITRAAASWPVKSRTSGSRRGRSPGRCTGSSRRRMPT